MNRKVKQIGLLALCALLILGQNGVAANRAFAAEQDTANQQDAGSSATDGLATVLPKCYAAMQGINGSKISLDTTLDLTDPLEEDITTAKDVKEDDENYADFVEFDRLMYISQRKAFAVDGYVKKVLAENTACLEEMKAMTEVSDEENNGTEEDETDTPTEGEDTEDNKTEDQETEEGETEGTDDADGENKEESGEAATAAEDDTDGDTEGNDSESTDGEETDTDTDTDTGSDTDADTGSDTDTETDTETDSDQDSDQDTNTDSSNTITKKWTISTRPAYYYGDYATEITNLIEKGDTAFFEHDNWQDVILSNKYVTFFDLAITDSEGQGKGETYTYDLTMSVYFVTNLSHEETGVQVNLGYISVPDDIEFSVKDVAKSEAVLATLRTGEILLTAYDFILYSKGEDAYFSQFEDGVSVRVPIDKKYAKLDNIYARYISDEGKTLESDIPTKVVKEGDQYYVEFTVHHFSTYAIVSTDDPIVIGLPDTGIISALFGEAASSIITGIVVSAFVGLGLYKIAKEKRTRIRL